MSTPLLRQAAFSVCHRTPTSRPRVSNIGQSLLGRDLIQKIRFSSSPQCYKSPMLDNQPGADKKQPAEDVSHPSISFKDLGASKKVRLVVITILMIYGTLESIFWMSVLWAKFGPAPKEEGNMSKSEEGKSAGN